jgi:putative hydrolase of the HAD superfamily
MTDSGPAVFFDLDDTIYPERQFKLGGFRQVAGWLAEHGILDRGIADNTLREILADNGSLYGEFFDDLCLRHGLGGELVPELIRVFRQHEPQITLYEDFRDFVESHGQGSYLGVITDGLAEVQRKKIVALGLRQWMYEEGIIITDALKPPTSKLDPAVFVMASRIAGREVTQCIYVGDNPDKDFRRPAELGWLTVRLLRGSHSQLPGNDDIRINISSFRDFGAVLDQPRPRWL